jgi:glutamate---cysteine ligase / carboxylate-amine ligase
VGAEEEYMLLRPGTHELVPAAKKALAAVHGEDRFTGELPLSQIEARTDPCRTVPDLASQLASARCELAEALEGSLELASAGTHPLAPAEGELANAPRYDDAVRHYGSTALRRQLVFAFQVHVAPGDAACSLAVYNALRSYLPEIAALSANAPFHGGEDTGLASVRPGISLLLPRQGVPPAFGGWEEFSAALKWGEKSGVMVRPGNWWWELRPRPSLGTLEVRVPDAQITVPESAAVAALVHSLVVWLAERHCSGEELSVHADWRIAENRWLAARDGTDARLVDLETGERYTVDERLRALIDEMGPVARELGCERELGGVEALLAENGAKRQRRIARESGLEEVPGWLASQFLAGI